MSVITDVERLISDSPTAGIEESRERLAELRRCRAELFGVEHASQQKLDKEIAALEVVLEMPGGKLLDPTVFTWRWPYKARSGFLPPRRVPLPKLALLKLNSHESIIRTNRHGWDYASMQAALPNAYLNHLPDIQEALQSIARANRGQASLRYSWHGHIPARARSRIQDLSESDTFEQIYLLAETRPSQWKLMETPGPPRQRFSLDPLVLGLKSGRFFVVDKFDPTSLEQYAGGEWTT